MLVSERRETKTFDYSVALLSEDNKAQIKGFICGNHYPEAGLADYLENNALDDIRNGNGVTYIIKDNSNNRLIGYYTLEASSLPYFYRDEEDEDYEVLCGIPAVKINMFAIDSQYQDLFFEGKPISAWILESIISEIYNMSVSGLGIKAIYLRPLPSAEKFYLKNGFTMDEGFFKPFASADDELNVMFMFIHHIDELDILK